MRVLVTGATGFVGSALCPLLIERGHSVVAVVRGTAAPPAGCAPLHMADIGPDTDWQETLHGIESVVHLAARVHVMRDSAPDPLAAFRRTNVGGTLRLAQAAHAAGVSRFVFLSSLKAVGELTEDRPFNDATPAQPRDPYGISKREAEIGLAEIAEQTGLEVVILRPPLLYGPGVEGNFRALLRLVGRGVPLPLGGIDNARSLLYVENLADAIAACLTSPAVTGGAYLIRDGEDLSTPDLVRRLGAAMGRRVWLLPVPGVLLHLAASCLGRGPEAQRLLGSLRVDDSRLRDDLGWQPPFTVDQGLAATVASFRRAGA